MGAMTEGLYFILFFVCARRCRFFSFFSHTVFYGTWVYSTCCLVFMLRFCLSFTRMALQVFCLSVVSSV